MDQPPFRTPYAIGFTWVVLLAVGLPAALVLRPFLPAIGWAVVLTAGFWPVWKHLRRRMPGHPGWAAGLLTLAVGLLGIVPATLLAGVLVQQAREAALAVSARLEASHVRALGDLMNLPRVSGALAWVEAKAGLSPEALREGIRQGLGRVASLAPGLTARLALGTFEALGTLAVTLFLLFYGFRDGDRMGRAILALLPASRASRARVGATFLELLQVLFRGTVLCALAQGAAGAIGWWVAGLPLPALAGAAMGVLSILPVGGTALVWLPGVAWAWMDGHRAGAIFLLAWGLAVVSFVADNILRPLLLRGARQLSTPVVLLGVFGGLPAFGPLGLFLGPLILVLASGLLRILAAQARAGRPPMRRKAPEGLSSHPLSPG